MLFEASRETEIWFARFCFFNREEEVANTPIYSRSVKKNMSLLSHIYRISRLDLFISKLCPIKVENSSPPHLQYWCRRRQHDTICHTSNDNTCGGAVDGKNSDVSSVVDGVDSAGAGYGDRGHGYVVDCGLHSPHKVLLLCVFVYLHFWFGKLHLHL